ncbi:semaphorin-6C-like isoform X2 [Athene cunicularia]|uniref:semaphorin-6C-like isoform X2 n=1 Tax=Athene cunicularia TaxID=194338 RepID=UPI000EF6559B|nr:semaphorin-6C-like isoform X2 [Athene cunicularia]
MPLLLPSAGVAPASGCSTGRVSASSGCCAARRRRAGVQRKRHRWAWAAAGPSSSPGPAASAWSLLCNPSDSDSTEAGPSTRGTWSPPKQQLVPYEEEEEKEMRGDSDPWMGPTGPYWEALDWEGGAPLSPSPEREGLLGLSPSLLASPPPPGPPDEVLRDLFADVYLGPQVPAVASQEAAASGRPVTPRVAVEMGRSPRTQEQGASPRPKKRCINGFIMFCRINRRNYMSQWAQRFNHLNNRVTQLDGDGEDDDINPPTPLQLPLAACPGTPGGSPLPP